MSELELCPKCQKGHLTPTGEVATDAEGSEQVGERGVTRKFVCDNPECEMHNSDLENNPMKGVEHKPCVICGKKVIDPITYPKNGVCPACTKLPDFEEKMKNKGLTL